MGDGFSLSQFLFYVDEDLNRVKRHNFNFKCTQTLRLIFMLLSFAVWGILVYVWAKALLSQLQFWILTLWLYAITTVAISAGRQVVEEKLTEKLRDEKEKDGMPAEQLDQVKLPAEERSGMWRSATIVYSIATPLVLASPIMFALFREDMFKGEVCKFYELAKPENPDGTLVVDPQHTCIANYEGNESFYQDAAGFRYQAFVTSLILPVGILICEMFLNQLMMTWKHIVYQYFFTAFYMIVTAIWQIATGNAVIFPNRLDWICYKSSSDGSCIFKECILWFIYFAIVQTGCFALLLLIHFAKSKYCCRKSQEIMTYSEVNVEKLGSLRSSSNKDD